jgi:hypothetical protein
MKKGRERLGPCERRVDFLELDDRQGQAGMTLEDPEKIMSHSDSVG